MKYLTKKLMKANPYYSEESIRRDLSLIGLSFACLVILILKLTLR